MGGEIITKRRKPMKDPIMKIPHVLQVDRTRLRRRDWAEATIAMGFVYFLGIVTGLIIAYLVTK
jgi:hypothetical protein